MSKKRVFLISGLGLLIIAVLVAAMILPAAVKSRVYGEPMNRDSAEVVELRGLFSRTAEYAGKNIIVEARIGLACQTSGCWITLTDGPNQLLVQFYDFTARLDQGTLVRVSGQLRVRNQAPYLAARGLEVLG